MSFFKKITGVFRAPNANVSITLSQPTFTQGQEVTGTLLVTSNEEFDASELRVELEDIEITRAYYRETVRVDDKEEVVEGTAEQHVTLFSRKISVSGAMHITQGFREEYSFRIPIPADAPITYRGRNASNKWTLKAVIGIMVRPDVSSHPVEVQIVPSV